MNYCDKTETINLVKTLDYLIDKEVAEITSENLLAKMQEIAALTQRREAAKAKLNNSKGEVQFGASYTMPRAIDL